MELVFADTMYIKSRELVYVVTRDIKVIELVEDVTWYIKGMELVASGSISTYTRVLSAFSVYYPTILSTQCYSVYK